MKKKPIEMPTVKSVTLSEQVVSEIVLYLQSRPYKEVVIIMNKLAAELGKQQAEKEKQT